MSKPPSKRGSSDHFQTPPIALEPLYKYLHRGRCIWECACGKGYLVNALQDRGYDVFGTDILNGYDFLNWYPDRFSMVVTNPPYSIKHKFLARAYQLSRPFALLLPLTAFETRERQELFETYGIEVIFMDKRIKFITPSGGKSRPWFAVAWFTWGLNIGKPYSFAVLPHV